MKAIVCPGIHDPKLTDEFMTGVFGHHRDRDEIAVVPASDCPVYSPPHLWQFLRDRWGNPENTEPVSFISFSAGVVGAIATARSWQRNGGRVATFIALDGWGVPLGGDFPIYRLSHDFFTHWSSSLLGQGKESFYADPPVAHLDLWRSPQTAAGWHLSPSRPAVAATAAQFIGRQLQINFPCDENGY
jgi:hypothetical protein